MLHPKVDGVWLRAIGAWDSLQYSHVWPRGSEELSFRMRPGTTHPALRGGAPTDLFDGGVRIWSGRMSEPSRTGDFAANGAWSEASGLDAVDGSGNPTNIPDVAIDAAIASGAVSWTRPASLSSVSWGTADAPMKLLQLLDEAMAGLGLRWYVDAARAVRAAADPSSPAYVVPQAAAGHGLALAEDDYYSHLRGTYFAGVGTFTTITVGDSVAATRWGRKDARVDLTAMGVISAPTATAELNARLALTGARLRYAESLQVGYRQLTTPGGTPVALTMPRAGQMVRLVGVTDRTRPSGGQPNSDIVIGRSQYADGAPTVTLTPVNKAARNLEELLRGAAA